MTWPDGPAVPGQPDSQWKPLPRLRTHEHVVAEVERRLAEGTLKAGDRLPPERLLAEALGVSRGAVREALRVLGALGVVDTGTGSGPASGSVITGDGAAGLATVLGMHVQLASLTPADFAEVRRMVGPPAARRAAESAARSDVDDLRALVGRMREGKSDNDVRAVAVELHCRIVQASGNALAGVMIAGLTAAQQTAFPGSAYPGRVVVEECAAIVEAIAAGDGELAAELVDRQLAGGQPVTPGVPPLRRAG